MLITDPIGDLFTRIRNISTAGKVEVLVPFSALKKEICEVLKNEAYLSEVKVLKDNIVLTIATSHRKSVINGIKNISRPGLRIYRAADKIRSPLGGAGITIVSTSKGVMTGREAKEKRLGGEVLGEVW